MNAISPTTITMRCSTSCLPRQLISPLSRVRHARRVGPPSDSASASAASGWVARKNAASCTRSTQFTVIVVELPPFHTPPRRACRAAPLRTATSSSGRDQHDTMDSDSTSRKSSSAHISTVSSNSETKVSASGPAAR